MNRTGVVTLLGAGASAESGYPLADDLLGLFREAVEKETNRELQQREELARRQDNDLAPGTLRIDLLKKVPPGPTTGEWFRMMWERFESITARLRPLAEPPLKPGGRPDLPTHAFKDSPVGGVVFPPYSAPCEGAPLSPAPTPYLETFFAFYDDYMRPIIAAVEGDPGALAVAQHRFRNLRSLAVQAAYRAFAAHRRTPATYLRRLFELQGPEHYGWAISTLNFDVTVEQVASLLGLTFHDGFGFGRGMVATPPPEWNDPSLEGLMALWEAVAENGHEFVGFAHVEEGANMLLKLHGSLGWYVLEEGGGDIGSRDELRHNTAYVHFRIPYEFLWLPDTERLIDQLAGGGPEDPVTRRGGGSLSRKAGALWIRPYLIFARTLKTHPDRLSLDVMTALARLLHQAEAILAIGYSWGDPHINDLIFDAVGRGARLVNVSRASRPTHVLALWMHRFPTSFHVLRRRLYMFGGGARRVLEENVLTLPSGETLRFDLVGSGLRVPAELSLAESVK